MLLLYLVKEWCYFECFSNESVLGKIESPFDLNRDFSGMAMRYENLAIRKVRDLRLHSIWITGIASEFEDVRHKKIQDGRRSPFWKSKIRNNSAVDRPIFTKFCVST